MASRKITKKTPRKPVKSPPGYGVYKTVHRLRHPGVTMLSEKSFKRDPLRAMETAVGLKPKAVVRNLRRRRTPGQMGR